MPSVDNQTYCLSYNSTHCTADKNMFNNRVSMLTWKNEKNKQLVENEPIVSNKIGLLTFQMNIILLVIFLQLYMY